MVESSNVTAGTNATALQYNNLRNDVILGKRTMSTEVDGGTITIDWSSLVKGNIRTVTLGGNRTIAFSNAVVGQSILVRLIQDGVGSRTVTWPSGINWPSGNAPTLSTAAGVIDSFLLTCVATGEYDASFVGFGLT